MVSPELLLRRLNQIGAHLSSLSGTLALIGVGSVGADLDRLDEHSDLDFFVIVDGDSKQSYVDSVDWLTAVCPVVYSFANTSDGRKALFSDGVFAEYAVFAESELVAIPYTRARIVWQRDPLANWPTENGVQAIAPSIEHQLNEALTNLYVGLHRELRGERLTAERFIQQFAVDRLITVLDLLEPATGRDRFEPSRRIERRHPGLPLAQMVPGYERNRYAARVILGWLEERFALEPAIVAAIRNLL